MKMPPRGVKRLHTSMDLGSITRIGTFSGKHSVASTLQYNSLPKPERLNANIQKLIRSD